MTRIKAAVLSLVAAASVAAAPPSDRLRVTVPGGTPLDLGAADIALREILEDKIGWDMPEIVALVRPVGKKRKKR